MIICACYRVEEKDIQDILPEVDEDNMVEEIMGRTRAGVGCRTCISDDFDPKCRRVRYILDIVEEYRKEKQS